MFGVFYSITHMQLADATAILFSSPLFATIFAAIILREVVGWRRAVATALGFVGILVMMRPGGEAFEPAALVVVRREVDLLAARVGGHDEVGADPVTAQRGLERDHVERAHAVHRDVEDEAQRPGRHEADPQARERAGSDADGDRGQVLAHDPGVGEGGLDERGELLAVLHPLLGAPLDDDLRTAFGVRVEQRDGHERRGRVEGEQHVVEVTEAAHRSGHGPCPQRTGRRGRGGTR